LSAQASRRDLLAAAGAAGAAALLVPARARAAGEDPAILTGLIRIEQAAALAYAEIARHPGVNPRLARIVKHFGRQEDQHAAALVRALGHLGGTAPSKPARVPGLDRALAAGEPAILRFSVALENRAVAAYYDALRRLDDSRLLQMAAEIMGNEGQHLVVLRERAGREPVPDAFETGHPA